MMKMKNKIYGMYVLDVEGSLSKLANIRDAICYDKTNEINFDYEADTKEEFISEVLKNQKVCFVSLKNGYEEVDVNDLNKYFTKNEILEAQEN